MIWNDAGHGRTLGAPTFPSQPAPSVVLRRTTRRAGSATFQGIIRDDGSAYDAESYLKSDLPNFKAAPTISGLVATGFGDYLVARYTIDVGKEKGTGMRLTVFRKSGNTWLVVAHANLAGRVH